MRSKKQKQSKKRKREKGPFSPVVMNQGLERKETERQKGKKERKRGRETRLEQHAQHTRVATCKIKRRSWTCANKRAMAPDM
jgi:hypothetical protein